MEAYSRGDSGNRQTRDMFIMFNFFVGSTVAFVIPLFSATLVNLERERDTWELLATTPISKTAILVGKLLSAIFFVWIMLLSLIPIYSLFMPIGGVSPTDIAVIFIIFTEVIFMIGLIGLFCSLRWDSLIKAITMTYIIGFMYALGFSFARVLITEIFNWGRRENFGPELVLSPAVVVICYFANEGLPSDVGTWIRNHPYTSHTIAVLIFVSILIFLCYYELKRYSQKGPKLSWEERWRQWWKPLFPKFTNPPSVHWISDRWNPVFIKDLRRQIIKWKYVNIRVLFYHMAGYIVILFCLNQDNINIEIAIAFILAFPFIILPSAVAAFRHEFDRDTWTLLTNTTLKSQSIVKGKMYPLIVWYLYRFVLFVFPIMLIMSFSNASYVFLEHLTVYIILSLVIAYFFLSSGMFFAYRSRKTVNAYIQAFGLALMIFIGIPLINQIILEINYFPSRDYFRHLTFPLMSSISPFFVLFSFDNGSTQYLDYDWKTYLFFQGIWMLSLGGFLHYCMMHPIKRSEY